MSGFYEDERIRRKNKQYNEPKESVPILPPVGEFHNEKNTDISDSYVTDGSTWLPQRTRRDYNSRSD